MSPCGRSSTSTSCPTSWTATSPRRFTRSSPPGLTPPPPPRRSLPYNTLSSSTRTPSSTWPTPSWSPCPSALSLLLSPLPFCAAKPLSSPVPLPQSCPHKSRGRGVSPTFCLPPQTHRYDVQAILIGGC